MLSIFIPGTEPANQDTLTKLGCGSLVDNSVAAMKVDGLIDGPNGEQGRLFYVESPGSPRRPLVSVDRDTQAWHEAVRDGELPRGRYWLGYWSDQPPTPEDLQRGDQVDGRPVQLADENFWNIPIADFFPKRLIFNVDTGEEEEAIFGKDSEFVKEANELFNLFLSEGFQEVVQRELVVRIPNGLSFAATALAVNYRVNRDLVNALQLIGQYESFDVARVATGLALVDEANQKKTSPLTV